MRMRSEGEQATGGERTTGGKRAWERSGCGVRLFWGTQDVWLSSRTAITDLLLGTSRQACCSWRTGSEAGGRVSACDTRLKVLNLFLKCSLLLVLQHIHKSIKAVLGTFLHIHQQLYIVSKSNSWCIPRSTHPGIFVEAHRLSAIPKEFQLLVSHRLPTPFRIARRAPLRSAAATVPDEESPLGVRLGSRNGAGVVYTSRAYL
jgi:hypothetical protein